MDYQVCSNYYKPFLYANESFATCAGNNRTSRKEDLTYLLLGVPIPLLSVIVNMVILLAAGMKRKILRRHNYVFSSVCSTLVSNMLYAVLSSWMAVANYFRFMEDGVRHSDEGERISSEKWWIARNSTLICLLLAMCGNIGSLVFVLMDSTYFVGRNLSRGSIDKVVVNNDPNQNGWRFRLKKRRKAQLLIALSWLVPGLLVFLATFANWNCLKCCCPPGHYTGDSCAVEAGCSRFWPPLTQSFLGVFLGVWLVEVLLMVLLLIHTSMKFRRVTINDNPTFHDNIANTSGKTNENEIESNVPPSCSLAQARRQSSTNPVCDTSHDEKKPDAEYSPTRHKPSLASDAPMQDLQKRKSLLLRFVRKFYSKMKSMIFLTAAFFVFTLPVAVGIIVDISTGDPMPGRNVVIVVGELSTFAYTLVCPIILLKFMPKLKLSVTMCLFNCGRVCSK